MKIASRPKCLTKEHFSYCPGCTHGIGTRLVAEALDELGLIEETVGVLSVGCSVMLYKFIDCDFIQAPHGRASAVAVGVKRALPEATVFAYQGDGDLAAIGTAEIVHAAARGDKITIFFLNNAIYGMTGGQMAPTTVEGQATTTTPAGRDPALQGYPIRMTEMLSTLDGVAYAARVALNSPRNVRQAKRAVRRAFEVQQEGLGFAIVEMLSTCPTNWGVKPTAALELIDKQMLPTYPLGEFKVPEGMKKVVTC